MPSKMNMAPLALAVLSALTFAHASANAA